MLVKTLSTKQIEMLRAMYEEKFMRIYEVSKWATDKELQSRLNTVASLYKGARKNAVKQILKYVDGKKSVWDIAIAMREDGHVVSPEDVIDILEKCRREGIVRVRTVAQVALPKAEVYAKTTIAEADKVIEQLKPEAEVVSQNIEILKKELESVLSTLETQQVEVVPEEVRAISPLKIVEDTLKLKASGVINSLFQIDKWISALLIATTEGDPIVLFSPKPVDINQAEIAAASSVILATSSKYVESFGKKPIRRILVLADKGIMVIKPLINDYLLVSLINREAKLGIVLRDIEWISNEITNVLQAKVSS